MLLILKEYIEKKKKEEQQQQDQKDQGEYEADEESDH